MATLPSDQFCLRWNNYHCNMTSVINQLLHDEAFVDVTLACEGARIKAHRVVLSACSPYFQRVLLDNPCKHPVLILPGGVGHADLRAIVEFIYRGETYVTRDQLSSIVRVAELLKIKGLCEVSQQQNDAQQGGLNGGGGGPGSGGSSNNGNGPGGGGGGAAGGGGNGVSGLNNNHILGLSAPPCMDMSNVMGSTLSLVGVSVQGGVNMVPTSQPMPEQQPNINTNLPTTRSFSAYRGRPRGRRTMGGLVRNRYGGWSSAAVSSSGVGGDKKGNAAGANRRPYRYRGWAGGRSPSKAGSQNNQNVDNNGVNTGGQNAAQQQQQQHAAHQHQQLQQQQQQMMVQQSVPSFQMDTSGGGGGPSILAPPGSVLDNSQRNDVRVPTDNNQQPLYDNREPNSAYSTPVLDGLGLGGVPNYHSAHSHTHSSLAISHSHTHNHNHGGHLQQHLQQQQNQAQQQGPPSSHSDRSFKTEPGDFHGLDHRPDGDRNGTDDNGTLTVTPELLGLIPSSGMHPPSSQSPAEPETPTKKMYTPEAMEMALNALRTQSMSLTRAASTYGIPSTTLWQRAHRLGIDTPMKKDPAQRHWTEEDMRQALDALRAGRISANRASKEYGIPSSTLYKIARKEGIKLAAPFNASPTSWTHDDLNRALEAIRGGLSVQRAATQFGIPSGTLYGRCKREGIELVHKGFSGERPWSDSSMADAIESVRSGEMSINQAAIHFNVPYSSLYNRVKRIKAEEDAGGEGSFDGQGQVEEGEGGPYDEDMEDEGLVLGQQQRLTPQASTPNMPHTPQSLGGEDMRGVTAVPVSLGSLGVVTSLPGGGGSQVSLSSGMILGGGGGPSPGLQQTTSSVIGVGVGALPMSLPLPLPMDYQYHTHHVAHAHTQQSAPTYQQ